ncbi:MAG: NAD(P)/FAD-dependent oxidoreductase [Pedobacter sp.]|nr:MAG: NAD(P)/FAD-dependent oxidoreductase [Pedobacter sp.]
MKTETIADVIIIGGSYAGLSAAMALGRALKKVIIIDSGKPCNAQTPHSHNFLTRDGETPDALRSISLEQVLLYPSVKLISAYANSAAQLENGFRITTNEGKEFICKKLILATGVKDIFPEIKGFSDCWGISVIHCPYCHGYEVKHANTGIIANGEMAFEFAKLIHNWTKNLILFSNGAIDLDSAKLSKLAEKNIQIVEDEVEEIVHENGKIKHLLFRNGNTQVLEAVYARGSFEQNTNIISDLSIKLSEQGFVEVDNFKQTSIFGIYAAGDCTTMMRTVSQAVASGTLAGVSVSKQLMEEEF